MGFLRTVLHYAQTAWSIVFGLPGDVGHALSEIWKFIGSVHALLDNLFSVINRQFLTKDLTLSQVILTALGDILDVLERIKNWIWAHQVNPVRKHLIDRINRLQRWTARRLLAERIFALRLYFLSVAYAFKLVSGERKARIADVKAARAYSLKLTKAALATVQREAVDGYSADRSKRESLIAKLADEIANRNPAIRALVGDMVKLLLDAIEIDNPIARLALGVVLKKVIDSLGIDKVAGNLLGRLIDGIAGHGKPHTLQEVVADIALRLGYLEQQQAEFMEHGGPELEQAGDQWKKYGSLAADVALIGFFGQAVVNPAAWAAEVSNTAGVVVGDTVDAIASLLAKA
jgi:hypothetical protein